MKKKIMLLFIFATTLILTQLATADLLITNSSATETAWITVSSWKIAGNSFPSGYRTKGWFEIKPGSSFNVVVPSYTKWVYLRAERDDGTEMKPPDYVTRKLFPFWIHPNKAFTIVEAEDGSILRSNVEDEDIRYVPLYEFENDGEYTIPTEHQTIVRTIYFLPTDLAPLYGIDEKLNKIMKTTQQFFAAEMDRHGFGGKTFTFETDEHGQPLIHWIDGLYAEIYYHTETEDKVLNELVDAFDLTQDLYLIFTDITIEVLESGLACGIGHNPDAFKGYYEHWVIVPAFGKCLNGRKALPLIAHELGHGFGLRHDMRNDKFMMSYGNKPDKLSKYAAQWLEKSKFFNTIDVFSDKPTTIHQPDFLKSPPSEVLIELEVEDADGLHQVQLVIPRTGQDTSGFESLFESKSIDGAAQTPLEFTVPVEDLLTEHPITFQTIDDLGNIQVSEVELPLLAILEYAEEVLADLLAAPTLAQPIETDLLFNYPNPFNPETWIPYQLSEPVDVILTIYNVNGQTVRTLVLGHQRPGFYQSKDRAAYWDGRNALGEPVASGVYFYTLTAGDFTATRKMLILK